MRERKHNISTSLENPLKLNGQLSLIIYCKRGTTNITQQERDEIRKILEQKEQLRQQERKQFKPILGKQGKQVIKQLEQMQMKVNCKEKENSRRNSTRW